MLFGTLFMYIIPECCTYFPFPLSKPYEREKSVIIDTSLTTNYPIPIEGKKT